MVDGAGGTFIDPWNRASSFLYFRNAHPHSSHFQKCPFSPFNPQITFLILASHVAGSKPTIAEDATRLLRVIQIAGAYGRSPDQKLPDLTCGQGISLFIYYRNRQVIQTTTHTARFLLPPFGLHTRYPSARFGLPIHHVELGLWESSPHLANSLAGQCPPSLEKTPQRRHGDSPNIRSSKKHVINCGHAGECSTIKLRDGLQHSIRKHKA